MSLAEDAVPEQEMKPSKTEFRVANDPLSQLFKPLFNEIITQLPQWFVEDQTVKSVELELTSNTAPSQYFEDIRQAKIAISFEDMMKAFYGFYVESLSLKDELVKVFAAKQAGDPLTQNMIPWEMTELAEVLANDEESRKKVVRLLLKSIEQTLLHERGHALFQTYREAILKDTFPLPKLEKEISPEDDQKNEQEFELASERLRKKYKLTFSRLDPEERLVNTQAWADDFFKVVLQKLPTHTWENIAIDRYLGFLEELFVRIALFSEQTPNVIGLRWRISDELFFDTDIDNGYGFSLRIDCSILDYLEANGVKKTLDQLMQLYTRVGAFEVLKERLPEIWQVIKDQK